MTNQVDKPIAQELRNLENQLLIRVIEAARDNFYTFVKLMAPLVLPEGFIDGRHIELICNRLQEVCFSVEDVGKTPERLQLMLPPGSMKSRLASNLFPAWCLGRNPNWCFLAIGANYDFAVDNFGKPTKELIDMPQYKAIFPYTVLKKDVNAAGRWDTTKKGRFVARGAGQDIAGRRAHITIVDDALTEQTTDSGRAEINSWYRKGLRTRLLPRGAEIIINCLAGDTLIELGDGTYEYLKHIQPGTEIITFNQETKQKERKRVEAVIEQGLDTVFEIKTTNGLPLKANAEHPFLLESGEYRKVKDLKVGDILLASCAALPNNVKVIGPSLDEMWLLGLMFGDGWTINTKRTDKPHLYRYVTCLAYGIDEDLNQKALRVIDELFGVKMKKTKFGYYRTDKKEICLGLRQMGLTGNAHTKRVPSWVFQLEPTYKEAFLNGFIDADGHTQKNGTRVVGLCNEKLVIDIKNLSQQLGYSVGQIYKIEYHIQPPNSPIPIDAVQYRINIGFIKKNQAFKPTKILSIIELEEKEKVYDLTVEDNHNFIANGIVSSNTRWFVDDLSGFMLKVDEKTSRPWKEIKIPAILDEKASQMLREGLTSVDERFKVGTSFWPEFWPTGLLLEKKETMPPHEWAALYLQEPVMESGGIVKRTDFQIWQEEKAPKCRSIIISVDTALSQKDAANYSAYTVWGVFTHLVETFDNTQIAQDGLILLSAGKGRWDFTELCNKMKDLDKKYYPDYFLIEETSAGLLLIPEMQKRSMPVLPFKPKGDKTSRLQASTPYFQAKRIWIPSGKVWAEEVVAEVAAFQPRLKNQSDDYTDTVSQAIIWMRDHHKIDNDGFQNKWDEETYMHRAKTYWSSLSSGIT